MLDGKILTAVLASLATIAAALNGGTVTEQQIKSSTLSAPGQSSYSSVMSELMPESLAPILDSITRPPEPKTDVKAVFEVKDPTYQKISIRKATLTASNLSSFSMGSNSIDSDEPITFYGFTGKLKPSKNSTMIDGSSWGFHSSGVNVTGPTSVKKDTETRLIRAEDVERVSLKFKEVEGSITSNSSSTDVKGSSLKVNSFSGLMLFYTENSTLVLDGKVHRLEAGAVSFGG